jgi:heme-degrading monooxygenase HmoA
LEYRSSLSYLLTEYNPDDEISNAFPGNYILSFLKKEAIMIVRLTYFNFLPEKIEDLKKKYRDEIAPEVKQQIGNLDCKLLEPVNKADDFISMTVWDNPEDADRYHSSGKYSQLVDKVRASFTKPPTLKVYQSDNVMEPV